MATDKVQEARDKALGWVFQKSMRQQASKALDALIAAVREDERQKCIAIAENERLTDATGEPSDRSYNFAIDHVVTALNA